MEKDEEEFPIDKYTVQLYYQSGDELIKDNLP